MTIKKKLISGFSAAMMIFAGLPAYTVPVHAEAKNLGTIEIALGEGYVALPAEEDSAVYMSMNYMAEEGSVTRPSWYQGFDLDQNGATDVSYSSSVEGNLWQKRSERNLSGRYELDITESVKVRMIEEDHVYCDKIIWDFDPLPLYTVKLMQGSAGDQELEFTSRDEGMLAEDRENAADGQFFWDEEQNEMFYKFPVLPEELTAPDEREFRGWSVFDTEDEPAEPGSWYLLSEDTLTLEAKWEYNLVTLNANNGTEEIVVLQAPADEYSSELPECPSEFTAPAGSVFRAWNTTASGAGTWYDPGEVIQTNTDTVLYARWGDPMLSVNAYDQTSETGSKGGQFSVANSEDPNSYDLSYGCSNYSTYIGASYTVAAYPDNGYTFKGWYKGKYIKKDAQGNYTQDAVPYLDQLLSTERTYTFTVEADTVICPVFEEMPVVNFIDIGNVWTKLDPVNDAAFTAEINPDVEGLTDFIEIENEIWTSTDAASVISRSEPAKMTAGKTYRYSAVIAAKGDNVFDQENGFRFVYGGKEYAWNDIQVTFGNNGKTAAITGFVPEKTVNAVSLSKATVTGIAAKTYNGKAQAQNPTVKMTVNGTPVTLVKGTDYKLTYKNNKNAGTATVVITGIGSYTGTKSATFKISPKKVTPTVKLSKTSLIYNGKVQKPAVTVKIGSTKLTTASYTVSYASGRKNVGTYKVTVKLKGNYTGTKTVTFKIIPKGTAVSSLTKGKKAFTVNWKKQSAKMAAKTITGYQIQYSTKKDFSSGNKAVKVAGYNNTSKKISSLKANTTYYVRIRTYLTSGSTTYYSGWSAVKSVKTQAASSGSSSSTVTRGGGGSSSGSGIVYWVPNGEVYHLSRNCSSLSRSRTVYSGTIAESGKPRACKRCGG